jgi:hypothetical protein
MSRRASNRVLRRVLVAPFALVAAIVILVEDWLWDDLQRLAAALGRLPVLRLLEALVARLPPYAALLLFGAPSLLLVPLKILALYLISSGRTELGLAVVVGAKIVGTALVARIFTVTKPKLLRIGWFARLHGWVVGHKGRLYAAIKSTAAYRLIRDLRASLRDRAKAWLGRRRGFLQRRLEAARRLARRRSTH